MTTKLRAALERLAMEIDPSDFEKRRYEREEGAALEHAASVTQQALSDDGFTAVPFSQFGIEGTGFIIQHSSSKLVIGHLRMKVDQEQLRLWLQPNDNFSASKPGQPSIIDLKGMDDQAITEAVAEQIERVRFLGHSS